MITEVNVTQFAIKINGVIVHNHIPSRQIAEATFYALSPEQRAIAEIVPITDNGKSLLLG